MAKFASLSPADKVLKALELSQKGYTRQQIADVLYDTANPKNRLGAIRKLMARNGYVWNETDNIYVKDNKQEQTTTNNSKGVTTVTKTNNVTKQTQTSSNKQQPTLPFTEEEIIVLKELVLLKSDLEEFRGALQGSGEVSIAQPGLEVPMDFTKFTGLLQGTTLQLHREVWEGLDDFCKKHKVSKKAVVNEAIWDFLQKWGK